MRTVYKYRVPLNDTIVVVTAGRVTAARMLDDWMFGTHVIEFWVQIDTPVNADMQVSVVGTGHPIPDDFTVAATVFDGGFVWHLITDQATR